MGNSEIKFILVEHPSRLKARSESKLLFTVRDTTLIKFEMHCPRAFCHVIPRLFLQRKQLDIV